MAQRNLEKNMQDLDLEQKPGNNVEVLAQITQKIQEKFEEKIKEKNNNPKI